MEHKIVWSADSGIGKGLLTWHAKLKNDRGTRAMLRRCSTVDEAVLSPAYQHFYRYMLGCGWPEEAENWQNDKLAAIAVLTAIVKSYDAGADDVMDDYERNLPYRMSEKNVDRPLVSELRFRALLKIDNTDDLLSGLRRAMPLIKAKTSLLHLASDVYWWGDKTKKEWAYAYRWPQKASA